MKLKELCGAGGNSLSGDIVKDAYVLSIDDTKNFLFSFGKLIAVRLSYISYILCEENVSQHHLDVFFQDNNCENLIIYTTDNSILQNLLSENLKS